MISAILKRASQLLVDAEKKSKDMPENDKETLIKELIEELIKEQMVQKRMLGEFKDMAVELNNQYKKIANMPLGLSPEEELELEKRQKEKRTEKTELPDWIANSFIDPMYEKFDTARIKDLISTYEGNYKPDDFQVGLHKYQGRMTDEEIKKLYEAEKSRYEPAVNKLKKLLDFQKAFEKKFEQIVKGEFHADTDSELMAKYREIEESVKNISEIIDESFKEAEVHIDPEKIKEMLLREAIDVVSTPTATKDDRETALKKLNGINANVLLTGKIISQLPPDEVAKLNLKKIPHIEKLEEVRGSELFNKPEILSQIKQAIKLQFPGGDDEIFEEECRNNPNLRLTITLANNKVISFFSKEKRSEKIDYIDWFIANPNAPIKGLGEATLKLGFNSEEENNKSYYAVAKPHAKSFQIFIENLGFAGFAGQTEKGEYKHYYSRLRRFPSDLKFKSKNLTNEKEESFFKTINYLCGEEGTVQDMIFDGRMMRVSKVKYSGQTAKDNISKADPEGLIMEEIDQQNKKGYVLTRFIPESPAKNNQVFYAVFEKDSAPEDLKEELAGVVSPDSSNLHSTSKKAFSN
ncbi:hypothetical protein HY797_00080 [Candidatus Falkowbacteria bacterium]|nr:hypothetical protein [Candidatus Falkowbacteria bacterium]